MAQSDLFAWLNNPIQALAEQGYFDLFYKIDPTAGAIAPDPIIVLLLALFLEYLLESLGPLRIFFTLPLVSLREALGFMGRKLNRHKRHPLARRSRGIVVVGFVCILAILLGAVLATLARSYPYGWVGELVVVILLLSQRGPLAIAQKVTKLLLAGKGVEAKVTALSISAGDKPQADDHTAARFTVEYLGESLAKGVVGPAFWYLLTGLPGLLLYRAITVMDDQFDGRSPRFQWFGSAARVLDEITNFIPARIAGLIVVLASLFVPYSKPSPAMEVLVGRAKNYRSRALGWPVGAMAGALSLALGGPRRYEWGGYQAPWVGLDNGKARLEASDIKRACWLYRISCLLNLALLGILTMGLYA